MIDHLRTFGPMSDNQSKIYKIWDKCPVIVASGVAGTGKSFVGLYLALEYVLDASSMHNQVIIARSPVAGREIGHLPGSLEEKAAVFETPYIEMAAKMFGRGDAYFKLKEQGTIDFILSSHNRGSTFDDVILIVDEGQNMSYQELSTLITRLGRNSRVLFCGDERQRDLKRDSGWLEFLNVLARMKSCFRIDFGVDDIVRGNIVKEFLVAEMES